MSYHCGTMSLYSARFRASIASLHADLPSQKGTHSTREICRHHVQSHTYSNQIGWQCGLYSLSTTIKSAGPGKSHEAGRSDAWLAASGARRGSACAVPRTARPPAVSVGRQIAHKQTPADWPQLRWYPTPAELTQGIQVHHLHACRPWLMRRPTPGVAVTQKQVQPAQVARYESTTCG